jgi:hypothetical protein
VSHARARTQDDAQRTVLALPPALAPYKCAVLPLTSALADAGAALSAALRAEGVSCRVDDSGAAIGRRYARMDEAGVPFALTLDPASLYDRAVTLRHRDTMEQARAALPHHAPPRPPKAARAPRLGCGQLPGALEGRRAATLCGRWGAEARAGRRCGCLRPRRRGWCRRSHDGGIRPARSPGRGSARNTRASARPRAMTRMARGGGEGGSGGDA